jgi:uncharacterized membrane protein
LRVVEPERGSIIPLILCFFLIAFLVVAGGVAASDAFTKQRDLQSVCDGAAVAAANVAALDALHRTGTGAGSFVPLTGGSSLSDAIEGYLARAAMGTGAGAMRITGEVDPDSATVRLSCRVRSRLAFDVVYGRPDGVEQLAHAAASSPIRSAD